MYTQASTYASTSTSSSPSMSRRRARAVASASPASRFGLAAIASAAALATLVNPVNAQMDGVPGLVNVTSISGTWSSGSGAVLTGPGFAQPTNFTFTYPNNTGISYSFTDDGYFEEAQYRFEANGTEPHCVQAIVIWQHGNYTLESNGSIVMTPIEGDGRIQVQDPCAAETNVITYYNEPALMAGWQITNDVNHNRYMLQLLKFDGSFMPRLYLLYRPPTMLPTQQLWTSEAYKAYSQKEGKTSGSSSTARVSAALVGAAATLGAGLLAWTSIA